MQHLALHLSVATAAANRNVKRVVGIFEQDQSRAVAELFHQRLQQGRISERIPRALEKKQRDLDLEEVLGSCDRGFFGRV